MLTVAGLGLIVGIVLALTGAGGGILAVPLLIFGVGLGVAQAAPIGLLAVGMAAALGAGLGLKAGTVRYKAALLIAALGMLFSPFGIWLANHMNNRWLAFLFALVLLFVAFRTFRQAQGRPAAAPPLDASAMPCVRDAAHGRFVWTAPCARALALSGGLAGFLSGLLGVLRPRHKASPSSLFIQEQKARHHAPIGASAQGLDGRRHARFFRRLFA